MSVPITQVDSRYMRSQMQIYPEIYETQKCSLEKGAVVRINCAVNMLFHFCIIFFVKVIYLFWFM